MAQRFELKAGQRNALDAILAWLRDPEGGTYQILTGFAGTGKTSVLSELCFEYLERMIWGTATTNKAAKVLREKLPIAVGTIHSLLGLKLSDDDETQRLVTGNTKEEQMFRNSLIIIDEASMMTNELCEHLDRFAEKFKARVLFVGDDFQLGPVDSKDEPGEGGIDPISPIWSMGYNKVELTEIIRYGGPIETLASEVRDNIAKGFLLENIHPNKSDEGAVYVKPGFSFYEWVESAAKKRKFLEPEFGVVIAYTNAQVKYFNSIIRDHMFGRELAQMQYLEDERIVMNKPFKKARLNGSIDNYMLRNKDEIVIRCAEEGEQEHPFMEKSVKYKVITIEGTVYGTSDVVRFEVIDPVNAKLWERNCQELANQARSADKEYVRKKRWAEFWEHKGILADVAYAYAMTSHATQGSTYDYAFVDRENIYSVKKASFKTRMRSFYVAMTRARHAVIIN